MRPEVFLPKPDSTSIPCQQETTEVPQVDVPIIKERIDSYDQLSLSEEKSLTSTQVIQRLQISKTTLIALRQRACVEPSRRRRKDPQLYSEADVYLMQLARQEPKPSPFIDRVSTLEICEELGINRETLRKVREILDLERPKIYRQGRYYTHAQKDAIVNYVSSQRDAGARIAPEKTVLKVRNQKRVELLHSYPDLAVQIAIGRFKDPSLIHIAQSALHEAVIKYDDSRGAFPAFAGKVITNQIIDELRKRKSTHTTALDLEDQDCAHPSQEDVVTNKIFVAKIMESLNQKERQIIKLVFFAGLTYFAASQLLNTPEGTLKNRVRLALEKLRNHPHTKTLKEGL